MISQSFGSGDHGDFSAGFVAGPRDLTAAIAANGAAPTERRAAPSWPFAQQCAI
jgi:hypothetical protein